MVTKQRIWFILAVSFLLQALLANTASGQTVTFSGQVTRHNAGNIDESVRGAVYIHYDINRSDFIEVPFVIEAGQRSTSYSKQVDWALAGSSDNRGRHDFFRLSVKCLENCNAANAFDDNAYFYENSRTALDAHLDPGPSRTQIETFGRDDRAGGYTVNFSLLPKYAYILGTIALPNGLSAPNNFNIDIFRSGVIGSITPTLIIHRQNLSFPTGESEVNFRYQIDLKDEIIGRSYHSPIFSFHCPSSVCRDLGLATGKFMVDSDADRLYSNSIGIDPRVSETDRTSSKNH